MWIIPKNLDVSACVRDTLDLNWDSSELSQILERSVTWRGKDSLARTWLQRLKRVSWMQHLSGRILKPLMANPFIKGYTSLLEVIPASRSVSPANEKEQMTLDTFGRILKESFRQLDLFGASSRTSQDTLQLDTLKFTEAYEIWVTKLRLACLQRQKLARHTRENDCLSWPTPDVANKEESAQTAKKRMALHKETNRPTGGTRNLHQVVNWATPEARNQEGYQVVKGKRIPRLAQQASWPTPQNRDSTRETSIKKDRLPDRVGLLALDSPSTNGKSRELWYTPEAQNQQGYQVVNGKQYPRLGKQVRQNWMTPSSETRGQSSSTSDRAKEKSTSIEGQIHHEVKQKGKLNPDWVEQLMGLSVGWTDLDSWETE